MSDSLRPHEKVNQKWSNRRWQDECRQSRNHQGLKWVNLTQMTIISKTVGQNPLEEME